MRSRSWYGGLLVAAFAAACSDGADGTATPPDAAGDVPVIPDGGDDVAPALEAWRAAGRRAYIYSSGAREAQTALFRAASADGGASARDLTPLLSGYFDIVSAGAKSEAASYTSIALSLGAAPSEVLFATDAIVEARAACAAGFQVILTLRPGNVPLPAGQPFAVVTSLADIAAAAGGEA